MDLGELKDECEALSSFLRSKLKADVTSSRNKIFVDFILKRAEETSEQVCLP